MSFNDYDDSIDFSNINFPENRIYNTIPTWEIAVKVATFIPIIFFGVVGNLVILSLIGRNRALRTPTNLLIANMAMADLLTLLICPIMFMFHDFYQNYKLGAIGCKTEGFLEGALLITAVLNLAAVSYDRLTAIVLPLEARMTVKGAKIVMALTWITGISLSIPLAAYRTYKVRRWNNFVETYCKENPNILPKYWYVLICILVWLPLGVMLISYTAIFIKLDRYEKKVLKREHPLSVSYKKKVAKTLFIVVVVFIILRVPFTVLVIMRANMLRKGSSYQVQGSFQILWYVAHYLIFLNAAVNPLIYGLNNDNFRRAYDQTPIFKWSSRFTSKKDKVKRKPSEGFCNGLKSFFAAQGQNIEITADCRSRSTKTTLVMRGRTNETNMEGDQFKYVGNDPNDDGERGSIFAEGFI